MKQEKEKQKKPLVETYSEEFLDWADEQEQENLKSLGKPKLTELVQMYSPEIWTEIAPTKISELKRRQKNIKLQIKKDMRRINTLDETERIIQREWKKVTLGAALEDTNSQIKRFETILRISSGSKPKGAITEHEIEQARQTPIEHLLDCETAKQHNGKIVILCPFHNEKTPSFTIFTRSNTYFCFGCSEKGDAITLARNLNNLGFVESVKFLCRI